MPTLPGSRRERSRGPLELDANVSSCLQLLGPQSGGSGLPSLTPDSFTDQYPRLTLRPQNSYIKKSIESNLICCILLLRVMESLELLSASEPDCSAGVNLN